MDKYVSSFLLKEWAFIKLFYGINKCEKLSNKLFKVSKQLIEYVDNKCIFIGDQIYVNNKSEEFLLSVNLELDALRK